MQVTYDSAALLRLLRVTATAANEASDIRAAAQVCLDETLRFTGWAIGNLYLRSRDGASMEPAHVWSVRTGHDYSAFQALTATSSLAAGAGLPGRVLSTGAPTWIVDVQRDTNFPRAAAAADVGLHAGLAFPILTQDDVSGVLEFFATQALEPNEALLATIAEVGRHLGRVIERQRAADDLRESELRFRSVAQATPDGIIIADCDDTITFCNRAAERMFGYESSAMVGRPLATLMPDRWPVSLLDRTVERTAVRASGQEFPVELSLSSWVAQGRRYFSGIIRDITDRRAAEAQARQDEERFRHAAKMHAVGMLAGGIAHDFNNVLTAIFGFSKVVLDELPDGELRRDVLEIRDAAERGAGLTRQLLAFSRQQVLRVEPIDVNPLLTRLRNMLARLLPDTIALELRLADDLPPMSADRTQVEQVVLNLAINARDAMPLGGRLTVETGLTEVSERQHQGASAGPHVVITIADSGVGMDADTLGRIFEPFFTTKGRMGTGIGLSTVAGIVQQTGGSITVSSTPGKGSTFKVFFPVSPAIDAATTAETPLSSETILLVEDDLLIRKSLAKILRQHGYVVLEAGSAAEALRVRPGELAAATILLSDVALPDRDGLSLAAELRARYPQMRALFMSGYDEEAVQQSGGGIAFLKKPFAPTVLVKRLQKLTN